MSGSIQARLAAGAAALVLGVIGAVAGQPNPSQAEEGAPIAGGYGEEVCDQYECLTFTAVQTGESIRVPVSTTPVSDEESREAAVQPYGLNPITIAQCNLGHSDVIVEEMPSEKDGLVLMKCGTENAGYIHIRERHEKGWQYFLDKYPIGGTWDDFMVFATRNSLKAPDPSLGMPKTIPDNKRCYSTPVQIRNPKGVVVTTLHPSAIVSMNNRILITSIPTSNTPHCK